MPNHPGEALPASLAEVVSSFSPSYKNDRILVLIPDAGISDHTNSLLFWSKTLFHLPQLQVTIPLTPGH